MKLKRILTLCCMLTMALGMASSASAADYSFETSANPVYYGSTNYEDLYDAGYNYGARNQIDYDIPEIQYGLSQEFLETSLNNPYLSSGIQYGLSGGSATTVYPESDFSNSSIISGGSLLSVPIRPLPVRFVILVPTTRMRTVSSLSISWMTAGTPSPSWSLLRAIPSKIPLSSRSMWKRGAARSSLLRTPP